MMNEVVKRINRYSFQCNKQQTLQKYDQLSKHILVESDSCIVRSKTHVNQSNLNALDIYSFQPAPKYQFKSNADAEI